jgi:predicted DNA-binding protein (UPF0251 family)
VPRPIKCRRVERLPSYTYFKPKGVPLHQLGESILTVEELEAIRLKDLEGLEQEQGASRMHVSRPTFQRILTSARAKIADALVNGKSIRIEGGDYKLIERHFICETCNHRWSLPFGSGRRGCDQTCPKCGGGSIYREK